MTHGSLFSGIGGFDLAARNCGITNIFQVEIDEFCQKVLNKNFPETEKYRDIKEFDGNKYQNKIDILSGGFPCQDISIAGINNGRKGLDGERSGLFYEMLRIINEIKPKYIIWENSPMIIKYKYRIINEFKKVGYATWFKILSARQFGFYHKRERCYGVCISNTNGVGQHEIWNFDSKFNKIHKSKEILRLSASRKAEFNRTYSPLLQEISDTVILRGSHGLSKKLDTDRIKSLGNSIVPQIAEVIFNSIINEGLL
jgi:DNA (cytosine-5)-methyltransferase 1